jgi:hypothetical protein
LEAWLLSLREVERMREVERRRERKEVEDWG